MKSLKESLSAVELGSRFWGALVRAQNKDLPLQERRFNLKLAVDYFNSQDQHYTKQLHELLALHRQFAEHVKVEVKLQEFYDRLPKNHVQKEAQFKAVLEAQQKAFSLVSSINAVEEVYNWETPEKVERWGKEWRRVRTYLQDLVEGVWPRRAPGLYSGPVNPPLMPTGSTTNTKSIDFTQHETACYCIYCNAEVKKSPEDLLRACETLVHKSCSHMLTTLTKIYGDPRARQNSGEPSDRDMGKP
jgi:hemoglobin-like flavoprotein